jgi:hypothetical protein
MRAFVLMGLVLVGCSDSANGGNGGDGGNGDMAQSPDMRPACNTPGTLALGPKTVSSGYASELGAQIAATASGKVVVTFAGNQDVMSSQVQGVWTLSTDNGATFGAQTEFPAITGTLSRTLITTADPAGNIWTFTAPFHPLFDAYDSLVLYKMGFGSTVFDAGVHAEDPSSVSATGDLRLIRPWMIVKSDGQPLVTWGFGALEGIRAGTTTDEGNTWSRAMVVTNSNLVDFGQPCQAKTGGRVWVVYVTGSTMVPISTRVRWSDDGGLTWPAANTTEVSDPADGPAAHAQPYCVADSGHLYVLYGLASDDPLDITAKNFQRSTVLKVAVSTDGGATFTRHDASDPGAGAKQYAGNLAIDETGQLQLAYYAGDTTGAQLVRSNSTDNGTTFCGAATVQSGLKLENASYGQADSIGRFIGQSFASNAQWLAWVDNSGAVGHVAVAKVTP